MYTYMIHIRSDILTYQIIGSRNIVIIN